jgi:hypothetical protein
MKKLSILPLSLIILALVMQARPWTMMHSHSVSGKQKAQR